MTIQVLKPKYDVEACLKQLRDVLESGWTGTGPKCAAFEAAWCEFTGAKNALFVSSATAALHLAVRLLDLPKGSKIATTPLTFVSTNAAITYEGHYPQFCDINPQTLALDVDSVLTAVANGAKAVIWVHYGGSISPEFLDFKKVCPVPIIEDCAHAAGAFYSDGTRVGSSQDTYSCFSFQSVKNLPTFDSGMLTVPVGTPSLVKRANQLSWLGIDRNTFHRTSQSKSELYKWKYTVEEIGFKYNGNDVAAAIALAQLPHLDRDNAYRNQLYKWYMTGLDNRADPLLHSSGSSHHLMVVRLPPNKRDMVIGELRLNGIAPGVHYFPNYKFPAFMQYHNPAETPMTETISGELLTLPSHAEITHKHVEKICRVILHALEQKDPY
jgi:dTDP-4-amino-4,6-dideoxygalactose transaminase